MDNVLSGAGQPVIINHDRHGGGCHNKNDCCDDLILSNQIQNGSDHNDDCTRAHGLHTDATIERFGLKTINDICDVKFEVAESKGCITNKILEEECKTRELIMAQSRMITDLIRDQETANLRAEVSFLQNQILSAGGVVIRK